jgi:hypothetical protein
MAAAVAEEAGLLLRVDFEEAEGVCLGEGEGPPGSALPSIASIEVDEPCDLAHSS